jgi:hypothetical protein
MAASLVPASALILRPMPARWPAESECALAPTWPGGPKECGQRPGAPRCPRQVGPSAGGSSAAPGSEHASRGASEYGGQPGSGAPRAPLKS